MNDETIAALERALRRAQLLPYGHPDAAQVAADAALIRALIETLRAG